MARRLPLLALLVLSLICLSASGCQTPPCVDPGNYGGLQHPGDTYQMFKEAIALGCEKEAYGLFSRRMRDEVVSFSEFSMALGSKKAGKYLTQLRSSEYVRADYLDAERSRARLVVRSEGELHAFPMVYEEDGWRLDWDPGRDPSTSH